LAQHRNLWTPDGRLALAVLAIDARMSFIVVGDARGPALASAFNASWAVAVACSESILRNRASGAWREYFSATGDFLIPRRAAAPE
jgi:hypothetical protein